MKRKNSRPLNLRSAKRLETSRDLADGCRTDCISTPYLPQDVIIEWALLLPGGVYYGACDGRRALVISVADPAFNQLEKALHNGCVKGISPQSIERGHWSQITQHVAIGLLGPGYMLQPTTSSGPTITSLSSTPGASPRLVTTWGMA